MQKLLVMTGCRFNAIIHLQVKHLEFLFNNESNDIILPDSKTGDVPCQLTNNIMIELRELVKENEDERNYVFYNEKKEIKNRYRYIRNIIVQRLKRSRVIPRTLNYCIGPHMFRCTLVNKEYEKARMRWENKARSKAYHSKNSSAIKSYLRPRKKLVLKY